VATGAEKGGVNPVVENSSCSKNKFKITTTTNSAATLTMNPNCVAVFITVSFEETLKQAVLPENAAKITGKAKIPKKPPAVKEPEWEAAVAADFVNREPEGEKADTGRAVSVRPEPEEKNVTDGLPPKPESEPERLKRTLSAIHEHLVFDPRFYVPACDYLQRYNLDEKFLSWLCNQCLLKKPRSLNGLYYKLFFAPNMAELFRVQYKPQAPPPVKKITCPVCGNEHNSLDGECPVCGLRKQDRGNRETVEKERRVFRLPPDRKAAFQKEGAVLLENPFQDFFGKVKRQKDIYRKYGIA
jgi:hypothetical protein